jgi:uncharacterized membrane protein
MNYNKFTSLIFGYFIRGLLLLAPIFLTVYIIYGFFNWLDSKFYFYFPGAGILTVVVSIITFGFIGTTFIFQPIVRVFEVGISHIPLVKFIYFSAKDLISAFVGDNKKFSEPVLIQINESTGISKIGFITQSDLDSFGIEGYISVYCPHSYAFSGEMYVIPKGKVKLLDISTSEAMKFIVSGGVSKGVEQDD